MKTPRGILIDLDDTIIAFDKGLNIEACWLSACQAHADRLEGVDLTELVPTIRACARRFWGQPENQRWGRLHLDEARQRIVIDALSQVNIVDETLAERIASRYVAEREAVITPFPGAVQTVEWLRDEGYRLALVTNGDARTQRRKIDRFNLARLFDTVLVEGEFGYGKPHESVYQEAMRRLDVRPDETWMVGDNFEWEVAAPMRLGITGIWIDHLREGGGQEVQPYAILSALSELPGLLQRAEAEKTMEIPRAYVDNMRDIHGESGGAAFIRQVQQAVGELAERWGVVRRSPVPLLSYNYVESGSLTDGTDVMLKVCGPGDDYRNERTALTLFGGRGSSALLASDDHYGAMLLQRLTPGTTLPPDDPIAAAEAFAHVMNGLPRAVPAGTRLPDIPDWAIGLSKLRDRYDGGTGPLPADLVGLAETLFRHLWETESAPVLLHGDLHHENILRHGDNWFAIDPKGLVGGLAFEPIAFLNNHLQSYGDPLETLRRQVDCICTITGVDKRRLLQYGVAHSVLKAWWCIEDHGRGWEPDIANAHAFQKLLAEVE